MFSPSDITGQKKGFSKKYLIVISVFLTLASSTAYTVPSAGSQSKWICNDEKGQCIENAASQESVWFPTVELCRLVCGEDGAISPKPKFVKFYDKTYIAINPTKITVRINEKANNTAARNVIETFINNLHKEHPNCHEHNNTKVRVDINVISNTISESRTKYDLTTRTAGLEDESAFVQINTIDITGLQCALRTLSQLVAPYPESDNTSCLALVRGVLVDDEPAQGERS